MQSQHQYYPQCVCNCLCNFTFNKLYFLKTFPSANHPLQYKMGTLGMKKLQFLAILFRKQIICNLYPPLHFWLHVGQKIFFFRLGSLDFEFDDFQIGTSPNLTCSLVLLLPKTLSTWGSDWTVHNSWCSQIEHIRFSITSLRLGPMLGWDSQNSPIWGVNNTSLLRRRY